MSTFNGIIPEFQGVRADFFRHVPGQDPPLACFLSHVHSDHLQGLESFRSPFIYCSSVTKVLLLKLQTYPHRLNLARNVLEAREVHYRHLKHVLRPLPLQTPTEIELSPGYRIQVTLFDANHCPGAVMFLIEGQGRAVLYTGDIRAEPWWVNSLTRHPILLPYCGGGCKLDNIYLDTSFARTSDIYKCFPSKAAGLQELVHQVKAYPSDTVFHFHAWTLGDEDVFVALARALNAKVHVDAYKMSLYQGSGREAAFTPETLALCSFPVGNGLHAGCLTTDPSTRLHACEFSSACDGLQGVDIVRIVPVITRNLAGKDVLELGAVGGDSVQKSNLSLDLSDFESFVALLRYCSEQLEESSDRTPIMQTILDAAFSATKTLDLSLPHGHTADTDNITLAELVSLLQSVHRDKVANVESTARTPLQDRPLRQRITFPYSRHSSFGELQHLVSAFRPLEVFPCVVDEKDWTEDHSMAILFGAQCSGSRFRFDIMMREKLSSKPHQHAQGPKRSWESMSSQEQSQLLTVPGLASLDCRASPKKPRKTSENTSVTGPTTLGSDAADVADEHDDSNVLQAQGNEAALEKISTSTSDIVSDNSAQSSKDSHLDHVAAIRRSFEALTRSSSRTAGDVSRVASSFDLGDGSSSIQTRSADMAETRPADEQLSINDSLTCSTSRESNTASLHDEAAAAAAANPPSFSSTTPQREALGFDNVGEDPAIARAERVRAAFDAATAVTYGDTGAWAAGEFLVSTMPEGEGESQELEWMLG